MKDQNLLMKEIVFTSKVMKKTFKAFNLNIEKIGNVVSQLHIQAASLLDQKKIALGRYQFGLLKKKKLL